MSYTCKEQLLAYADRAERLMSVERLLHMGRLCMLGRGGDTAVVAFDRLREQTVYEMSIAVARRVATNPIMTAAEKNMGVYTEVIEPPLRGPLVRIRDKGYQTYGSGFHASDDDPRVLGAVPNREWSPRFRRFQELQFGDVALSESVGEDLRRLGAFLVASPNAPGVMSISFEPEAPDLAAIGRQWDAIARVLPDQGRPALPSQNQCYVYRAEAYWPALSVFYGAMREGGVEI